jgi:cell division protein FtsB
MLNARLRRGGFWLRAVLACVLGVILAAATLVGARIEITSLRYELGRLHEEEIALRERVEALDVETAALRAPEHIRPRARALGLTYPASGQVVQLPLPAVATGQPR